MEKPWLALYPQQVPHSIDYPRKPLQQFLQEAAEQFPQKTAIHFLGKELTYKEIYEQAIKLASYLQQLGLQKGDRVSIMLPNCPQAVISYYAVLFAGGIVVQTNPLYTERELEYQLNDSGAKVIIALDLLYPRITKVKAHTKIEHVIITSIKDYLPFPKNVLYPFVQKKQTGMIVRVKHEGDCHLFTKALSLASGKVKETDVDPIEDIALLQYTGGTTGFPKAAMLTHYNLTANTFMCTKWMYKCERGNESILGVLPFFHVYGMTAVMNLSIMERYKMILLPKFDVETTLKTIEKQRPTLFPGAPTIYIALLNHPNLKKYDLSSIKICISGSAPLPVEVQEQFETVTGGKIVEGYGLTEASPVTHSNFIWDGKRIKGSIGVPWPDTEAMIVSLETGEKANINEIGEIVVRGPQVMKGYWNRPEETAATLREYE